MIAVTRAVFAALLVSALGCRSKDSATITDAQRAEVTEAARRVVDTAFAAIVRVDPPALMRTFADGPEATFSADGIIVAGHDSIASFFRSALASWRTVDSASLQNVRVAVLSPDAGVVTALYREHVTDNKGTKFWNAGAWTSTVARRNGEWKVVDSHASHARAAP